MSPTDSNAAPPTIEVEHLVRTYSGVAAVDDVSFTVRRGEIVGLLGAERRGEKHDLAHPHGIPPRHLGSRADLRTPLVASRTDDANNHPS